MSDWVNHSHLKDVNNASFGFQWCFFFAITPTRKWKTTRHIMHAANCRVFFHGSESNERTKFSELGPRRYVNDVSFRFQWVFFSIRLTRKWKTTGHITQAVIFGCFLSWKYRSNQSKTNEASKTKQKKWRSNLSYKLSLRCDI